MNANPYGPRFWFTYLANLGLMVTVSLLFRYADFIQHLGGTEKQLGVITGLGMVGAITARCFQGVAIDRYGAHRIWLLSLVLLVVCLLGHLWVQSLHPPGIHLLRILYTVSLAGAFGASITYVTLRAPPSRMGEMIGMLGSSGFIGMAIGPSIGDWLFSGVEAQHLTTKLFTWSTGSASFSLVCAVLATWGESIDRSHSDGSALARLWTLVRKYHPGWTLLVGFAMGIGIGMPGTFLSAFASERGIADLGWFWLPYATVAFVVRILTRTLADEWGTRPTILTGLILMAGSMIAYLVVSTGPTLMLSAALGGMAHAFLFPATVSEGNQSFPSEYRGLATNLMLTMFDIGLLIGQPVFGWSVEISRANQLDGYAVSFTGLACMLVLVAVVYTRNKPMPHRMKSESDAAI